MSIAHRRYRLNDWYCILKDTQTFKCIHSSDNSPSSNRIRMTVCILTLATSNNIDMY